MKSHLPTEAHEALLVDLKTALEKHKDMPPIEMLAIASILVGQLITFQDQTKWTSDAIMELVSVNIQAGNMHAAANALGDTKGNA